MDDSTHTTSTSTDPSTLTFDDLIEVARLFDERELIPKEIRIHPTGYQQLRDWVNRTSARHLSVSAANCVFTFGAIPVLLDETLKNRQWKAVDSKGNVLSEGFL
jgi:hypothetical protein